MTDEQKAEEFRRRAYKGVKGGVIGDDFATIYADNIKAYCLDMAEWKEQQMIQWLEKHAGTYQRFDVTENRFFYNYTEMINDFKKAMKGE